MEEHRCRDSKNGNIQNNRFDMFRFEFGRQAGLNDLELSQIAAGHTIIVVTRLRLIRCLLIARGSMVRRPLMGMLVTSMRTRRRG